MTKKVHCPWCTRNVSVKKGRLSPHLGYGGKKCVGTGVKKIHAQTLFDAHKERRDYAAQIGRGIKRV